MYYLESSPFQNSSASIDACRSDIPVRADIARAHFRRKDFLVNTTLRLLSEYQNG